MLITVWNSGFAHCEHQRALADALRRTCVGLPALKKIVKPHDVSVCVPDGWMDPEDATVVIVELFEQALSPAGRKQLAKALGTTLRELHFASALHREIRVMVRPTILNELDREALWTSDSND